MIRGFILQSLKIWEHPKWRNKIKHKNDPKVIPAKIIGMKVWSLNPSHAEPQRSNDIQRKND